jgi:hypothetical protein
VRLLPRLRTLLLVSRQLTRCADALERLANVAEGRTPAPTLLPEADEDPPRIEVMVHDDAHYARVEAIEGYLFRTLRRQPTPEEICAELDGLPVGPEEAAAALRKKLRVQ